MKQFKFLSILFLFGVLFTVTSCDKDDDTDPTPTPTTGDVFLTCKIDGTSFTAEPLTVGTTSTGNNLTVQGNGEGLSAKSISMALNSTYNGVGTYKFGANALSNTAIYLPQAINPADAFVDAQAGDVTGEITVTLDDGTYVEGTFFFDAANQNDASQMVSITEGTFRAKIP